MYKRTYIQMMQSDKPTSVLAGCRALGGLADMDAKCRKKLRDASICPALDGLVQDSSEEIRYAACQSICAMAKEPESAMLFVKLGTLRLLVHVTHTEVRRALCSNDVCVCLCVCVCVCVCV
jgi:hypothetical protein